MSRSALPAPHDPKMTTRGVAESSGGSPGIASVKLPLDPGGRHVTCSVTASEPVRRPRYEAQTTRHPPAGGKVRCKSARWPTSHGGASGVLARVGGSKHASAEPSPDASLADAASGRLPGETTSAHAWDPAATMSTAKAAAQ